MSALEEAIVHAEREAPLVLHLEAAVDGFVDIDRLRRALARAVDDHPLCRVTRARPRAWSTVERWRDATDDDRRPPLSLAVCANDHELGQHRDSWVSQPLALDVAPLFEVLLARLPDHDVLLLRVHHAMCDGIGAVALLRSIVAAYALDEVLFAVPGDPHGELERRRGRRPTRTATRADAREHVRAPRSRSRGGPARVPPRGDPKDDRRSFVVLRSIDRATTAALGLAAGSSGTWQATTNDLLLTAFHRVLSDLVGDQRGVDAPITVTMPVTGRSRDERSSIVANLTKQATTWTTAEDRISRVWCLDAIAMQTADAKDAGGRELAALARMLRIVPVRLRAQLPRLASRVLHDRVLDTARLSNLGRFDQHTFAPASTVRFTSLHFSAPTRMPQGLTVGCVTFDGSLHLTVRANRALGSRVWLRRVADDLVDELTSAVLPGRVTRSPADVPVPVRPLP